MLYHCGMNELVFDIGMHIGEDSRHYLKKGYKVIAVEANPILAQKNAVKFKKHIDAGQLTILNVGIADKEDVLPFYVNHRLTEWSSFDKEIGTRNNTAHHVVDVPCVTTRSLFEKYGMPYYLKVDIEGFDHYCLLDIPETGNKPKYVSCEAVYLDWLDILKVKGYTKFKIINQANNFNPVDLKQEAAPFFGRSEIIKNGIKLRIQKYLPFIPFKHMYGSTGPAAEETKGPWLSYEAVKDTYLRFYQYEKKIPLNSGSWFDFHATF